MNKKIIQISNDNKNGYPMYSGYPGYIRIVKQKNNKKNIRAGVLRKSKNLSTSRNCIVFGQFKLQKCLGNPDIFGPQHDCGWCGGGGCGHCR